jgi:ABC-type glycerol-3-phosphate transport system substrate-binding protein
MTRSRLVLLGLVVSLAVAACSSGNISEQVLEGQEGVSDVSISDDGETVEFSVETDDGTVAVVSGGGALPDDWPIPLPNGGEISSVVTTEDGGVVIADYPKDQYDALIEFYQDFVDGSGWEVVNSITMTNPSTSSWNLDNGDGGEVAIVVRDAGVGIQVQHLVDK